MRFPSLGENIENRPEASNLLTLYAALKGVTFKEALAECGEKNFSAFKQMLTDAAVAHLSPITQKMRELLAAPDHIRQAYWGRVPAAGSSHRRKDHVGSEGIGRIPEGMISSLRAEGKAIQRRRVRCRRIYAAPMAL